MCYYPDRGQPSQDTFSDGSGNPGPGSQLLEESGPKGAKNPWILPVGSRLPAP